MTRRPLELRPFRGLRFDPAVVGDLGTVVSPPYDVLDAAIVQELERANRHNVVRLILSRYFEPPYRAVRRRLERWRAHGYLRVDDEPSLYLYQYAADGGTVRGLIGLVGLRDPEEQVILPHEDVLPAPVQDRTLLMRTTETNLEPILLIHPGTPGLLSLYESIVVARPLAEFTAMDGSAHRVWGVTSPELLGRISGEIASEQALIADGHHRYAAYLELQRELGSAPGSPWRHGLAMLVADDGSGLHIGPIHRVVSGLSLRDVRESLDPEDGFEEYPDRAAADAARSGLRQPSGWMTLWLSDGTRWARAQTRRAGLDVVELHERLLPSWHVAEEQVSYHHSLDQALQVAVGEGGVVILVEPPDLADVIAAAANGQRLPRKSTSFGPKPRMGVVMRDLRDR